MTIRELQSLGRSRLLESALELELNVAVIEADMLIGAALGIPSERVLLQRDDKVPAVSIEKFESLLQRRLGNEPIAYILGVREFYSREFIVNSDVLIPRPETEQLVELLLKEFSEETQDFFFVDIGTGSGVIVLTLVLELREKYGEEYLGRGTFLAVDISSAALAVARQNTERLSLTETVCFLQSDLLNSVPDFSDNIGSVILAANLPYVEDDAELARDVGEFEPKLALRAGADGLDCVSRLIEDCPKLPSLAMFLEIGQGQGKKVLELAKNAACDDCALFADLQSIERIAVLRF